MAERIVPNNELKEILNRYAETIIEHVHEMNHNTYYYSISSTESVLCSSNYCKKTAITLKVEVDHMRQNFVAFMCDDCAPNL